MKRLIRYPSKDRQDRPFMVIWEVTQACDLVCQHCRASAQPLHHKDQLTFEQGRDLIDQVKAFGAPAPLLVFTGGDPFKREDLFDLVAYAKSVGLMPGVSPSATPLVTRDRLARLGEAGAKVISLSLDASNAADHDRFRGVEGSYALTLQAWREAQEVGLKVQINSTVNRHNLHDLANIAEIISDRKVMTWSLFFLVPTGRATAMDSLTPAECEAVMHFLLDASPYLNIKTTEGHHFKRIVLQRAIAQANEYDLTQDLDPLYHQLSGQFQEFARKRNLQARNNLRRTPMHIGSANGFVFVNHLGDVYPSGFLPMAAGNVKRQTLPEIYKTSDLFCWIRDLERLKGRCGSCEFRSVCGGSRSRAFAMLGDPMAEDPFCNYQPGSFPFQKELALALEQAKKLEHRRPTPDRALMPTPG
ncbi:MAG: TIGR04053 family radical SAM/SPASM domain-containing protein [Vulcanimicrobiota bacterium]